MRDIHILVRYFYDLEQTYNTPFSEVEKRMQNARAFIVARKPPTVAVNADAVFTFELNGKSSRLLPNTLAPLFPFPPFDTLYNLDSPVACICHFGAIVSWPRFDRVGSKRVCNVSTRNRTRIRIRKCIRNRNRTRTFYAFVFRFAFFYFYENYLRLAL